MKSRLVASPAFAVAAAGFVVAAALSYWNEMLGLSAVLAWSVLVIVAVPMAGWALTIFAVPLQSLFALGSHDFGVIRATLLLALATRTVSLAVQRRTYRSPVLWLLLVFIMLVSAHDLLGGSSLGQLVRDTLFYLALGALYTISREFGARPSGMALGQIAIVSSALVSAAVSLMFLYLPFPELVRIHPSLDNLRLFGVQDNPNALAKLLVLALVTLACRVVFNPAGRRWAVPLAFVAAVLLAATGTKSALIASVATLCMLLPLLHRRSLRADHVWMVPAVVILGFATWLFGLAPWIELHAAREWMAHKESGLCYYLQADQSNPYSCDAQAASAHNAVPVVRHMANVVGRDLRLENSYAMVRVNGKTRYTQRPFNPLQVGQRDRTWEGGLIVIARHWVWGIGGPDQWAQQMQEVTGYPFTSPHNGLLEVTGGYGMLGALLYLSVIAFFIRNYLILKRVVQEPWQRLANELTLLCGVAVFVVEGTEVLTVFGATIHAIWFWVILGLQAGLQDAVMTPATESGHVA